MPLYAKIQEFTLKSPHSDALAQAESLKQEMDDIVNIAHVRFEAYLNLTSMRYRLGILQNQRNRNVGMQAVEKKFEDSVNAIDGIKEMARKHGMSQVILDLKQEFISFASDAQSKVSSKLKTRAFNFKH